MKRDASALIAILVRFTSERSAAAGTVSEVSGVAGCSGKESAAMPAMRVRDCPTVMVVQWVSRSTLNLMSPSDSKRT